MSQLAPGCRDQTNSTYSAVTELLCDLSQNHVRLSIHHHGELKLGVQFGQRTTRKLHVDNWTCNGDNSAVL
jgi:hypothetical protein